MRKMFAIGISLFLMIAVYSVAPSEGVKKKEIEAASVAEAASEETTVNLYTVYVVDEKGNPVSDAMVQICDDNTCQVLLTDDQGMVSCPVEADSYDVHILKVPDGYETPDELFGVSKERMSLWVTVEKAK